MPHRHVRIQDATRWVSVRILCLMVACASLWGCQEGALDDGGFGVYQGAIQGGYTDDVDKAVVGVVGMSGGGWGFSTCSGTLIAPTVVLTAQHCVSPVYDEVYGGIDCDISSFGPPDDPDDIYITTRTTISNNAEYYGTREILVPPGNGFCGHDIAIMILDEPVPDSEASPFPPRVDQPVQADMTWLTGPGETYSAIGYGNTGDGWNAGGSGTRRRLDDLNATCVGLGCQDGDIFPQEWLGDTGVCSGDSGGPAVDVANRVIGVVSRGGNNCSYPIYGSVYEWADWIMAVTVAKSQEDGLVPPEWALGGSTDPTFSWPVGGLCLSDADCFSGICQDGYCSRQCNEENPCPESFFCEPSTGLCTAPAVGGYCDDGSDCDSGFCLEGLCTRPCTSGLPCPPGYNCDVEGSGLCDPISVGAACETAMDCEGLICVDGLCSRECDEDVPCPIPFTCYAGLCLLAEIGASCDGDEACDSGLCVDGVCTRPCDELPCEEGWSCDEETGLCDPPPPGSACETDEACPGSLCVDAQCAAPCASDDTCEEGLICADDGVCVTAPVGGGSGGDGPPTVTSGGATGGCASGPGGASPLLSLALLLGAWVSLSRRRTPQLARSNASR